MTEENEILWGRLIAAYQAAQAAAHRPCVGAFIHVSGDIWERMNELAREAGAKMPFASAESLFCGIPVVNQKDWADGLIQVRTIQAIA